MANSSPQQDNVENNIKHNISLIIIGIGTGLLAGLSVSPVISVVITSVMGAAGAVIAILSGVRDEFFDSETNVKTIQRAIASATPVPLMFLILGLVVGASLGVWVRTHDLLSPKPSLQTIAPSMLTLEDEIQIWIDLGIDKDEAVRSYFEQRANGDSGLDKTTNSPLTHSDSVLFATASKEECGEWQDLIDNGNYDDLPGEVASSEVEPFHALPTIVPDAVSLAALVEEVLCADIQP